ncbi:MAG: response regulator transcription factor [Fusobacterium sp. JB019]|nr:response regulator transcription factor [Fusobacterium sp. JB020]MDP0506710.1 response regulator transcription factor [Fusobacterium sp. JB019]
MNLKILIVEDDLKLRRIIKDFLLNEKFNILETDNGEDALDLYFSKKPNLIILDLMIPKLNGFEVLKEIRTHNKDIPIIMLTARGDEDDILKGYNLKINEYIIKPVSMKILVAKVKAFLRKDLNNQEIIFKDLILNIDKRTVKIKDEFIEISQKEFEILNLFLKNKNKVLTREEIITSLWGYEYSGDIRAVDSQIKRLRKKINRNYILTVRGLGYKLEEDKNEN